MKSKRRLSNVKLTTAYHFRYMGLWVAVCGALLLAANVLLFMLVQIHFQELIESNPDARAHFLSLHRKANVAILAEAVVMLFVIAFMAKFTAHRIAGVFIRLQRTCDTIREGNRAQRLKFRKTDGLEHVEKSFNGMLDTLTGPGEKPQP